MAMANICMSSKTLESILLINAQQMSIVLLKHVISTGKLQITTLILKLFIKEVDNVFLKTKTLNGSEVKTIVRFSLQ